MQCFQVRNRSVSGGGDGRGWRMATLCSMIAFRLLAHVQAHTCATAHTHALTSACSIAASCIRWKVEQRRHHPAACECVIKNYFSSSHPQPLHAHTQAAQPPGDRGVSAQQAHHGHGVSVSVREPRATKPYLWCRPCWQAGQRNWGSCGCCRQLASYRQR